MKELSLNILDITENSVKAESTLTKILITETSETLTLSIIDNGKGMPKSFLESVTDPFTTSRTTRKVGMGLPLLKLEAEQTGGHMTIESVYIGDDPVNHGTKVEALFYKDHIDFTPLGDVVSSVVTLIQGHPDTDFYFRHETETGVTELDTRELREILGEDVPLSEYEVIQWIEGNLREQYMEMNIENEKEDGQ